MSEPQHDPQGGPEASVRRQGVRDYDAVDLRPVGRWLAQFAAVTGLELDEPPTTRGSRLYLDTADWRFHRAGATLIRHRQAGRSELELSARAAGNAVIPAARCELGEGGPGDLRKLPGPVGDRIRAVAGHEPVNELLELHTSCRRLSLARAGTVLAAIELDEHRIPLGEGQTPIRFARLAIDSAYPDDEAVRSLHRGLVGDCGVRPAATTVDEMAFRARGLTPPGPPELGARVVSRTSTVGELAFAVLRRQFARVIGHEPGTRLGEDIEALHDMRVAVRRMRAALRLFGDFLPLRASRLRTPLGWLGRSLGEVRDLDVQIEQVALWRASVAEEDMSALDAIRALLDERRGLARARMLRTLDSRRYQRLVERVATVLRLGPVRRSAASGLPAVAVGARLIGERFAKVMKLGGRLDGKSPASEYHRLRIRAKALRYALEFHSEIYGRPVEGMIRALVELQDLLGAQQDAVVALERLRGLVGRSQRRLPPETIFVIGMLAERYGREARKLRRRFPKVFAGLGGRRWQRLRDAMAWSSLGPPPVVSRSGS